MFNFAYFCHEKATFFSFFSSFRRFFFMLLLETKNSFYLVWKKQVCGMFDYAGGCIITSFVDITFFCFAISFLSSLSFKVLNWSKFSSDTSRLDPISIRSRPNPNPIPTRDFLSIETRLGVKEEGDEADVLADWLELLLQTAPERKKTKNSAKVERKKNLFDWSEF